MRLGQEVSNKERLGLALLVLPMNSQKIDVYLDDGGAFPAGLDMVMILPSAERRFL